MKFSLATSLLILVLGGAMGLMQRSRLTGLRQDQAELVTRAGTLGITVQPSDETPLTKRQREEAGGGRAGEILSRLVPEAKEMEQREKSGEEISDTDTAQLLKQLVGLDAGQLKQVIAGVHDDPGLSDEMRGNLTGVMVMLLAEQNPAAALALVSDSKDLLADESTRKQMMLSALTRWSKQDPQAALSWMRGHTESYPELAEDETKQSIISGAAETDPKLAIKLMVEMKPDDVSSAISTLVETGTTPEKRSAVLAALREYATTLPDETEREDLIATSLEDMARSLSNEKLASVKTWLDAANLNPAETSQFAAGLSYFNTKEETGQWIDWMAGNLPAEDIAENVDNLVGQWTQQDYLAAGRWLSNAAEGPAKAAAVKTYAATVAEYEPQTAVQWALTLPADERQETFEAIYENWPKRDSAAAEAFAKAHGIEVTPE
ncbi:hypothetical protein JIN84_13800 [Luteolibacter yonseiensis]|uniref:Uncharacterized protein n=1 Tax=Luteolibacter yonseiensis TaxID=1144680 RepID=A0A934VC15_9BACT|nr:hypothetical protein [Luteolibacter yonseiensis]MBK1816695.1 hypothetical protein [Luteolibacter yonseiensis]